MMPVADRLSAWCTRRAPLVVLMAVAGTVGCGLLAGRLHLETDFSALLPDDHPSVRALRELQARVGGESRLGVVIESPSFTANRRFAEALIPAALAARRPDGGDAYFPDVEYRRDVDFLAHHALYLATDAELDRIEGELRYAIARARLAGQRSLRNLLRAEALRPDADHPADEFGLEAILPTRYPISPDSTLLVLRFAVSGSQTDVGFLEKAVEELQQLVQSLGPTNYHADLRVEYGDRVARQLVEVRAILRDVRVSLLAGASAVLLVVFAYFGPGRRRSLGHALRVAFVLAVPLSMSLVWTFGFAYVAFGSLNLFTATLGLVLFGLGIDYGIHYYARYLQARDTGLDRDAAIRDTHRGIGAAIAASAATTAVPLFVLVGADFRGFSEFGVIGGVGILFAAVAMVTVLPALVVLLPDRDAPPAGHPAPVSTTSPAWRTSAFIVAGAVLITATAPFAFARLQFQYDFSKLEPRYPEYEAVNRKFRAVFPRRGNPPAYVLAEDAERAATAAETLRQLAAADSTPTIDRVESFADRFPIGAHAAARKLERIAHVRELAADPHLADREDEELEALRRAASTRAPIPAESLPPFVSRAFAGRGGELGRFLLVYPSIALSDGRQSMAFADDVGTFTASDGRVYHGASTSIVAASMLRTMLRESPRMIALSLASIVLLMWLTFRSWRWSLLALCPLVVGAAGIAVVLAVVGIDLTFYNLAAIPAILGIGNDCGVHLAHRYRQEGPGSAGSVLRLAGEPVAIGGLTTMVGFSGLLLTSHPGLVSIGELAAVGVGVILLATLLVQPAVFRCLEGR